MLESAPNDRAQPMPQLHFWPGHVSMYQAPIYYSDIYLAIIGFFMVTFGIWKGLIELAY